MINNNDYNVKINKYLNEKYKEALRKFDASKDLLDIHMKDYYEGQVYLLAEMMEDFEKFRRSI